jgi:outer membrane protein
VYDFNKHASLRSTLSQDLLGHKGGATLQTTARYEIQISPRTEVSFAAGFTLADATYMRSYMGVPASASGREHTFARLCAGGRAVQPGRGAGVQERGV